MKINSLFYVLIFLSAQLCGMESLTPEQALALVQRRREEIVKTFNNQVQTFPWLPGYFVKADADSRIQGTKILADCIAEHKLNLLIVPRKWKFELPPSMPNLCLCERIEGTHQGRLNLEQVTQVVTLVTQAERHYFDLHPKNLLITKEEQVAFVDNALNGFIEKGFSPWRGLWKMQNECRLDDDAYDFLAQAQKAELNKLRR